MFQFIAVVIGVVIVWFCFDKWYDKGINKNNDEDTDK